MLPPRLQKDIDILRDLDKKGRIHAEAMSGSQMQWRITREGYAPCFISITTGAVTQHGRRAKAQGLKEALALMGVAL